MKIYGIEQVKRNIKKVLLDDLPSKSERAVFEILRRGKGIADTLTPIETSTLVNSGYRPVIVISKDSVIGHIGYTASYAAFVHNAPGTMSGPRPSGNGNYWGPDAEPRFLEKGFEAIKPEAMEIIKNAYK